MKKPDKGFTIVGVIIFLTLASTLLHMTAASQLSALEYRGKRIEIIDKKAAAFNQLALEVRNERK